MKKVALTCAAGVLLAVSTISHATTDTEKETIKAGVVNQTGLPIKVDFDVETSNKGQITTQAGHAEMEDGGWFGQPLTHSQTSQPNQLPEFYQDLLVRNAKADNNQAFGIYGSHCHIDSEDYHDGQTVRLVLTLEGNRITCTKLP